MAGFLWCQFQWGSGKTAKAELVVGDGPSKVLNDDTEAAHGSGQGKLGFWPARWGRQVKKASMRFIMEMRTSWKEKESRGSPEAANFAPALRVVRIVVAGENRQIHPTRSTVLNGVSSWSSREVIRFSGCLWLELG